MRAAVAPLGLWSRGQYAAKSGELVSTSMLLSIAIGFIFVVILVYGNLGYAQGNPRGYECIIGALKGYYEAKSSLET